MAMKLSRYEKEIYSQCLGHCRICLLEGGCALEKKLKKERKYEETKTAAL